MLFSKLVQNTAAKAVVRTQVRRAGDKAFVRWFWLLAFDVGSLVVLCLLDHLTRSSPPCLSTYSMILRY